MWDIATILEQNNRSALEYMMRKPILTDAESPQPKDGWSLSLLASILKVGPPRLEAIVNCLKSVGDNKEFAKLVDMLLPEHADEIMQAPRNKRVYSFCFFFGKKYYPLPANMDCPVTEWTDGMPLKLMGLSYSQYHELDMRPGYLLLLSLVVYPYEGDDRDAEKDLFTSLKVGDHWIAPMGFEMVKVSQNEFKLTNASDEPEVKETIMRTLLIAEKLGIKATFKAGRKSEEKMATARIPLLDKVQNVVGREIVRKIPKNGWYPCDLHKMTDNTRFEGVGEFADYACSTTGCALLDTSHDDCAYVEGMGEPVFKWTEHNVAILTKQWPKVQEIRAKIENIVEWLEQDQANHFVELVNFLMDCKVKPTKKEDSHIPDRMDRECYLDMATDYDEEDSRNSSVA